VHFVGFYQLDEILPENPNMLARVYFLSLSDVKMPACVVKIRLHHFADTCEAEVLERSQRRVVWQYLYIGLD
jgi:hypothetical protein